MSLAKLTPEQVKKEEEQSAMAYKLYNSVGQQIAVDAWFTASEEIEPPTLRLIKLRNDDGVIITAKPIKYISNTYKLGTTVFFVYMCVLQYELDNGQKVNIRKKIIFKPEHVKWFIID